MLSAFLSYLKGPLQRDVLSAFSIEKPIERAPYTMLSRFFWLNPALKSCYCFKALQHDHHGDACDVRKQMKLKALLKVQVPLGCKKFVA
jgi:hypothetical protein